jgi:hypothetical protein
MKALKKHTESVELQQEHFCWTRPPSADNLCTCFFCGCASATAMEILSYAPVSATAGEILHMWAGRVADLSKASTDTGRFLRLHPLG